MNNIKGKIGQIPNITKIHSRMIEEFPQSIKFKGKSDSFKRASKKLMKLELKRADISNLFGRVKIAVFDIFERDFGCYDMIHGKMVQQVLESNPRIEVIPFELTRPYFHKSFSSQVNKLISLISKGEKVKAANFSCADELKIQKLSKITGLPVTNKNIHEYRDQIREMILFPDKLYVSEKFDLNKDPQILSDINKLAEKFNDNYNHLKKARMQRNETNIRNFTEKILNLADILIKNKIIKPGMVSKEINNNDYELISGIFNKIDFKIEKHEKIAEIIRSIEKLTKNDIKVYLGAGNNGAESINMYSFADRVITVGANNVKTGEKTTYSTDNSLINAFMQGSWKIKNGKIMPDYSNSSSIQGTSFSSPGYIAEIYRRFKIKK